MAISKKRRGELVKQYGALVKKSEALVITSYSGLRVKGIDQLRRKVRDASGEFHVVKNTLAAIAIKEAGLPVPEDLLAELHHLFLACNEARYAPSKSIRELQSLVPKVESVIRRLQALKSGRAA